MKEFDLSVSEVSHLIDELMQATFVYNKSLYEATLRQLKEQG